MIDFTLRTPAQALTIANINSILDIITKKLESKYKKILS